MELLVISVVYNQPKFLDLQYSCLKNNLSVPFNFIIFDNSDDNNITNEFNNICSILNITYIRVPQEIHKSNDASSRAGKSLDFALRHIYNTMEFRGILMVNDSDLFLVKKYNPIERIGDYDIIGRSVENIYKMNEAPTHPINLNKIYYYSNQYLLLDYSKFKYINNITFLPIIYNNIQLDCGGQLYSYFKDNINIKHGFINDICSGYLSNEIMNDNILDEDIKKYLLDENKILNKLYFFMLVDIYLKFDRLVLN
jgi:hypothetical protein